MPTEKVLATLLVVVSFFTTVTQGWNYGFQWEIPLDADLVALQGRPTEHGLTEFERVALVTQCAFHCLQDFDTCQGFSHRQEDSLCVLYNTTVTAAAMDSDESFVSYDVAQWKLDQVSDKRFLLL